MNMRLRTGLAMLLLLASWSFLYARGSSLHAGEVRLDRLPTAHAGWLMTSSATFSQHVLDILKPTDYISRTYMGPAGEQVELYIGYHDGIESGGIHSPRNCMPGSGWHQMEGGTVHLDVQGRSLELVRAVYAKERTSMLVLYWFQVMGRQITNEYALKLAEIVSTLRHGRKDSAFVRILVAREGSAMSAEDVAERFVRDFFPHIAGVLPH